MAVWLCYAKFAKMTSFLCLIQINVCSMLYDVRTQDRHDKVKYRVCRAELYTYYRDTSIRDEHYVMYTLYII